MKLRYKQANSTDELKKILDLQRRNLPGNLTEEEKEHEGFVTVEHHLELLQAMNEVCGHVIAVEGDKLAGYALCMHPDFSDTIPVLQPMFTRIKGLVAPDAAFMVMGQICIDRAFRARGIFRGLYGNMQAALQGDYSLIITEVDVRNTRSMGAHKAIGFTTLCSYNSGGQNWEVLQLPTGLPLLSRIV
jgi:hypothetical protein